MELVHIRLYCAKLSLESGTGKVMRLLNTIGAIIIA